MSAVSACVPPYGARMLMAAWDIDEPSQIIGMLQVQCGGLDSFLQVCELFDCMGIPYAMLVDAIHRGKVEPASLDGGLRIDVSSHVRHTAPSCARQGWVAVAGRGA